MVSAITTAQDLLISNLNLRLYSYSKDVIQVWLADYYSGSPPPNWRALYTVLREADMEELSQQAEKYFCHTRM